MTWIDAVEFFSRAILLLLFLLSFWSVTIIIERAIYFRKFKSKKDDNLQHFKNGLTNRSHNKIDLIDEAFKIELLTQTIQFKKGLSILGTLGSTTPFIGLLGTILGIIVSFGELSKGTSDMSNMMFTLAEALILTAAGLIVAIPSVLAFNYFNKCIQDQRIEFEILKNEVILTLKK